MNGKTTRTAKASPGGTEILAAVVRGAGRPFSFERLTLEAPRPDEVLVRLAACGVCHTDIGFWEAGGDGPVVLGHEGAGVVEAVGAEVRGLTPGDHVVLTIMSCGRCPACLDERPTACENFWEANFGFSRLDGSNALSGGVRGHFFGQSSFATHALASVRNAVVVPRDLPLELLAPLGCGFQTGAGTVLNSLAVRPGQSLLVLGTGSVGLAAVMAGRLAGADPILAVDRVPSRLALALELGATHALESGPGLGKRIRAIAGKLDHAVDSTGVAAFMRLAGDLLRPGGSAALLSGAEGPGELPDGRRVFGVIQGDAVPWRFIPQLVDHFRAGRFPLDRLVTTLPFRDLDRAVAESLNGTIIKPVLEISPAFGAPFGVF
ncbi:NAD(P)-dependent alcohol dehydrogenase [Desulfovibrio aminophilus]|uniref:NAD(P)-dependent alcohol dehydrogenase n=1 Tax=Desulfovibrio aminophilus TaxID=81425 RepID=UPI000686D961|nr:NAD(P)-dependent alcohol dehydrogenase [Desulfovibrio aminophilus]